MTTRRRDEHADDRQRPPPGLMASGAPPAPREHRSDEAPAESDIPRRTLPLLTLDFAAAHVRRPTERKAASSQLGGGRTPQKRTSKPPPTPVAPRCPPVDDESREAAWVAAAQERLARRHEAHAKREATRLAALDVAPVADARRAIQEDQRQHVATARASRIIAASRPRSKATTPPARGAAAELTPPPVVAPPPVSSFARSEATTAGPRPPAGSKAAAKLARMAERATARKKRAEVAERQRARRKASHAADASEALERFERKWKRQLALADADLTSALDAAVRAALPHIKHDLEERAHPGWHARHRAMRARLVDVAAACQRAGLPGADALMRSAKGPKNDRS